MATTVHLGIRDALAGLLQASPALAGGRVHENREFVLAPGVESGIWVSRRQTLPTRRTVAGTMDWETKLEVGIRARKGASATAAAIADDLCASVYGRVMANTGLSGAAMDTLPGPIVWDQEEGAELVVTCTLTFTVQHRSTDASITA